MATGFIMGMNGKTFRERRLAVIKSHRDELWRIVQVM
jgi:hypothetical protein